jgi:ketosteroid isomerase-like protein
MLRKLTLLTLAGLVILAGCGGPPKLVSFKAKNQDEAVIASQIMKIQSGLNMKSVDLMMQPYMEDAYIGNFHKYLGIASPGAFRSISKSQLRGAYSDLFRGVKEISMEIVDFQLTVAGDRAAAQGRIEMVYKIEKGKGERKDPDVLINEVIWRLKRTPEGWKIQEEIFQ